MKNEELRIRDWGFWDEPVLLRGSSFPWFRREIPAPFLVGSTSLTNQERFAPLQSGVGGYQLRIKNYEL